MDEGEEKNRKKRKEKKALQCLKDAIQNHTKVDSELQVGKFLLKDKYLTQSAPDIHRKLQKSVVEGEKSLDQVMQLAMSVYYNWDITNRR
jgi:ribosomal protein L31E